MPRPDTGSFNRLLTSLGLILMAAALVIPYFFYRSTSTLQIDHQELSELTNAARAAIEARQSDVSGIQPFVLPAAAMLLALGIAILIWGGYRLHGAQKREDREAEARTIMAEAGVRDLTPGEKEVKINEEIRAETHSSRAERRAEARTSERRPRSQAKNNERGKRAENLRRIEAKVGATLSLSSFPRFVFRSQVAVGRLKLDGLFLATDEKFPDILVEIKLGTSGAPLSFLADQTLASIPRYEAERNRKALPWLIVVFPQPEGEVDKSSVDVDRYFQGLRKVMEPVGWATAIPETETDKLPTIFRTLEGRLDAR